MCMTFLKASVSWCPAGIGKSKLDSNISVTYFRIWTVTLLVTQTYVEFLNTGKFLNLCEGFYFVGMKSFSSDGRVLIVFLNFGGRPNLKWLL